MLLFTLHTTDKISFKIQNVVILKIIVLLCLNFREQYILFKIIDDNETNNKNQVLFFISSFYSFLQVRTNGSLQGITNCPWHQCRRLIYVQRQSQKGGFAIGYWPIPESFWPDSGASTLVNTSNLS